MSIYNALSEIEKESRKQIRAEKFDIYNRLHSIAKDANFVQEIKQAFPKLALLPNQRCGAWYVDPQIANGEFIYFKSTDGHMGEWDFNLRRANLHLLDVIIRHEGCIIVDSTRKGKKFPDALSKTIPLWCAVINQAKLRLNSNKLDNWDEYAKLWTEPSCVGKSEHSQIQDKVSMWAGRLIASSYPLEKLLDPLTKPLRPIFISSLSKYAASQDVKFQEFFPVVCLSASVYLGNDQLLRENGFSYVQGSGDDHEGWSMGLTSSLFWKHKDEILDRTRTELPEYIKTLVAAESRSENESNNDNDEYQKYCVDKTNINLWVGNPESTSFINQHDSFIVVHSGNTSKNFGVVQEEEQDDVKPLKNVLQLNIPKGKKGYKWLSESIESTRSFSKEVLCTRSNIIIISKDVDLLVALGLTILSLYFNDQRVSQVENCDNNTVTKSKIRTRLQWILDTSKGQLSPSRSILNRLNECLITA